MNLKAESLCGRSIPRETFWGTYNEQEVKRLCQLIYQKDRKLT